MTAVASDRTSTPVKVTTPPAAAVIDLLATEGLRGGPRPALVTGAVGIASPVAVVGLGYVGLPTALGLAAAGLSVIGVDISEQRLASVRTGVVDLSPVDRRRLRVVVAGGQVALTSRPSDTATAGAVFICVPTPVDEDLVPDLAPLRAACASVVREARPGQTIVLTSTSYVGTTRDLLIKPLEERGLRVGVDVHVAFSPERIDPGSTYPIERVPRVVGGASPACTEAAVRLLRRLTVAVHRVRDVETAEMSKLVENTYRAVNIALANEMADVAGSLGVDITEVIGAAATKPYGFSAFHPGPGAGGYGVPGDPHYLLCQLRAAGVTAPVVESAMTAIADRPGRVLARAATVLAEAGVDLAGARVHVVGVAYKPGVEDVRESPAVKIMDRLRAAGATVSFSDPLVREVTLPGGRVLAASTEPWQDGWDLVLVHTVSAGGDLGWLQQQPRVLDATFRLGDLAHRFLV